MCETRTGYHIEREKFAEKDERTQIPVMPDVPLFRG